MKKVIIGAALAVATLSVGAPAAFAGEATGQGRSTPLFSEDGPTENVNSVVVLASACSYSGLEDSAGPGVTQTPARVGRFTGIACQGSGGGRIDND